jgi:hypothetical protein
VASAAWLDRNVKHTKYPSLLHEHRKEILAQEQNIFSFFSVQPTLERVHLSRI